MFGDCGKLLFVNRYAPSAAARLPLRVGMIMRVWRVSMSVALLLVRVSAMEAAIRKLEEGRRAEELVGNDSGQVVSIRVRIRSSAAAAAS